MRQTILCIVGLLLTSPGPACGCRCVEPKLKTAYARADAIALVRITRVSQSSEDGTISANADVLDSWKAKLPPHVVVVSGEDCAYPFADQETYLLYLSRGTDSWGTFKCRGNRLRKDAEPALQWLRRHASAFTPGGAADRQPDNRARCGAGSSTNRRVGFEGASIASGAGLDLDVRIVRRDPAAARTNGDVAPPIAQQLARSMRSDERAERRLCGS